MKLPLQYHTGDYCHVFLVRSFNNHFRIWQKVMPLNWMKFLNCRTFRKLLHLGVHTSMLSCPQGKNFTTESRRIFLFSLEGELFDCSRKLISHFNLRCILLCMVHSAAVLVLRDWKSQGASDKGRGIQICTCWKGWMRLLEDRVNAFNHTFHAAPLQLSLHTQF